MRIIACFICLMIGSDLCVAEALLIRLKRSGTHPRFVYPVSLTSLKRSISSNQPFYVSDPAKGSPVSRQMEEPVNSASISITSIGQSVSKYPSNRILPTRRASILPKNPGDPSAEAGSNVEAASIEAKSTILTRNTTGSSSIEESKNDPAGGALNSSDPGGPARNHSSGRTPNKKSKKDPTLSLFDLLKKKSARNPPRDDPTGSNLSASKDPGSSEPLPTEETQEKNPGDPSDPSDPSQSSAPIAARIPEPVPIAPFIAVHISSSEDQYGALGSEYSRMLDPIDPVLSNNRHTTHFPRQESDSAPSDASDTAQGREPAPGAPAFGIPALGTSASVGPVYGAPASGAPAYGAPAYGAPVYEAPTYEGPDYSGPVFEAPSNGSTTIVLVLNNDFSNLTGSRDLQVGPFFFHFVRGNSGKIGLAPDP